MKYPCAQRPEYAGLPRRVRQAVEKCFKAIYRVAPNSFETVVINRLKADLDHFTLSLPHMVSSLVEAHEVDEAAFKIRVSEIYLEQVLSTERQMRYGIRTATKLFANHTVVVLVRILDTNTIVIVRFKNWRCFQNAKCAEGMIRTKDELSTAFRVIAVMEDIREIRHVDASLPQASHIHFEQPAPDDQNPRTMPPAGMWKRLFASVGACRPCSPAPRTRPPVLF